MRGLGRLCKKAGLAARPVARSGSISRLITPLAADKGAPRHTRVPPGRVDGQSVTRASLLHRARWKQTERSCWRMATRVLIPS
jgi:hypothetical protein